MSDMSQSEQSKRRLVRFVKARSRLIERCLDNEATASVIAGNPEILQRLDNLCERARRFIEARR